MSNAMEINKQQILTHLDEKGQARMVDVSEKSHTHREARAMARISMQPATLQMILDGKHKREMSWRRLALPALWRQNGRLT